MMQEFLEDLLKKIVDNPEAVAVTKMEETDMITFSIKVDAADAGKIIGKKGKTINSLKKLLSLYLYKNNLGSTQRIYLHLDAAL